ncbi:lipid kinase, YegS/Rv2252/BmrU family [Singulisphaera sp. GP187]|uniref:diacylglycerol/lipid kinase family protein n=1 Tax=Singulisphaera sp. GP187 TaxID=1882752 RepID=UPI00092A7BC9|nr:diacylglycerol kinase family protein [Singulisphaera sp. GP187]SIO42995.1 lipid kinase, YegS/Rv2252/BmrU family [Singulisphaera sp. GP187]
MANIAPPRSQRAFVILNPVAGQGAAAAVRQALAEAFSNSGEGAEAPYTIHETAPGEAIATRVREAAEQEGYDLIVAGGGDGTVSAVANGLVGSETPLGILPLGTANVLARELGIPIDLKGACQLLAGAHTVTAIDAMKVEDQCYFTQVGVGIDAMMIRDTDRESKRRFGRTAYLWTAFTRLLGFQPRRFLIESDGQSVRSRASQVVVANSGILGQPPFRWGPDIRPDDGRVDVCIVRARSFWNYVTLSWHVVLGQHKQDANVRYLTAQQHVVIATTKRPLPVQADGEIIGETPVTVTVVPHALHVIVPRTAGSDQ